MMKKLYVIFFLLCFKATVFSQADSIRMYRWEELNGASPDTIFAVSFSKMKLTELPPTLSVYKHLIKLDLSKNKLNELPDFLSDFHDLEFIDISKNEFSVFPNEFCRLVNLKTLIANRNQFDRIPECIGYLTELEFLDLWDTPVMNFPESIAQLKNLKRIDLQGVKYGPTFQKSFRETLPWVKIEFDPPCDCME